MGEPANPPASRPHDGDLPEAVSADGRATSTADLAERVRSGDREAETSLVMLFGPRVRRVVLARTGNRDVANDLSQEVLVATIQGLRDGRLRRSDCLPSYIQGVVRNKVNEHFRLRAARGEVPLEADDRAQPANDPVETAQLQARARRGLQRLEPIDRCILYMLLVEGLSLVAIAARLRLHPAAVRQRKLRALRRVRVFVQGPGSSTG